MCLLYVAARQATSMQPATTTAAAPSAGMPTPEQMADTLCTHAAPAARAGLSFQCEATYVHPTSSQSSTYQQDRVTASCAYVRTYQPAHAAAAPGMMQGCVASG